MCLAGFGESSKRKTTLVHGVSWFNQFADAKLEAARTGKPILLLSMFGKIDEEMPCANARTMRETVFNSPEFKKMAETEVVVAWEMVRAVPKVYIDLGDGKQLVRTVRGNAVSYLCNPDGSVFDALPGVYSKTGYQTVIRDSIKANFGKSWEEVKAYHVAKKGVPLPTFTTLSKSFAESPTLQIMGVPAIAGAQPQVKSTDSPQRKAFLFAASKLQDLSLQPMTALETRGRVAPGREATNDLPAKIVMADTFTNLTMVRPVVCFYFSTLTQFPTTETARDAILMDILKIPYKDPYFGLKDVLMPGTK